ncbi:NADPH-flavin oxidoreductase [Bacillus sp. FJAT-18017]|uniref:oxygen-insensitive NADPH nitroreductase n=1 Tax=Bacillus sp. FJAT-18017 TaxID=1705566 RepID=UPI0006AF32CA|nr:oxygen-insensitive NADPH nitroreductase [Bacillus sp. FJAT-18017]ALC91400.1 NADPH-flavin oxidoreductase [Bacillus sp. FJAT-18017]
MRNETINLLQSHRSIRRYKPDPIPEDVLTEILACAQWAPSSHNVQAYSIIVVDDQDKKEKLSEIAGNQKYVAACPVFLVFCADFYRLSLTCEMWDTKFEINEVENVLVAAVDTALAAENTFIAAKAYGLGGVMIGGIRNNPDEVKNLLGLPPYTIPMMGMCLGYPDQEPWQKPRTPKGAVVHYNHYKPKEDILEGLATYEEISSEYYTRRTNGLRTDGWTKQMAEYLSKPRRVHLKNFIKKQGFNFD